MSYRTDIIIKSFNRPYYLERCIKSIFRHVQGDYNITVLDDGTPPKYLQKIEVLFPTVKIVTSKKYPAKVRAINEHINNGKKFSELSIPVDLWVNEIKNCSDIFLLLEDDIWITSDISLEQVVQLMKEKQMVSVKLSWHGNDNIIRGQKVPAGNGIEQIVPELPYSRIMKVLFRNRFKTISILTRSKLLPRRYIVPYYTLYTIASAFFLKEYWLFLWREAKLTVDEWQQLYQSLEWKDNNKNSIYGKTLDEVAKTSFITSATNTFAGINLDIFVFNHYLTEAWYNASLDCMQNFPNDFTVEYLGRFLKNEGDDRSAYSEWLKWIERFKAPYKEIGCVVD